jgi:hypothetical protein
LAEAIRQPILIEATENVEPLHSVRSQSLEWRFLRRNAVGNLWAISYSLRMNLLVDGRFDHGLTKPSTQ